ncbi:hypothetical protein BV20DRAFT_317594 [Pilatotrama ljubarskyi]|nr:hypothetical protein BV20DRAFT_317594 [Pilatotrama ljubarskyi]
MSRAVTQVSLDMPTKSLKEWSPDVLSSICDYCDRDTLVQLSRTCRTLSTPAFRHIWHTLNGFVPLFETLPQDALEYYNESLDHSVRVTPVQLSLTIKVLSFQTVTCDLTASDVSRFRMYATFVRHVDSKPTFKPKRVSLHAWYALERANPGYLKNLRSLGYRELRVSDVTRTSPFHFLLGPRLEVLRVSLHRRGPKSYLSSKSDPVDPTLIDFLVSLPRSCPLVRSLTLSVSPGTAYARHALADAVCLLPHLTTLSVVGIPLLPHALCHLSALSSLTDLSMDARRRDYGGTATSCNPHHVRSFPALETLSIFGDTVDCPLEVLSISRPPRLVRLNVGMHASATRFASLARALPSLPFRTSLTQLRITLMASSCDHSSEAIPLAAFSPLFTLSRLCDIRVTGHCYVVLNDHALTEMAHAWPQLRIAHLCQDESWPTLDATDNLPTIAGLVEFARRCPLLDRFVIAMRDVRREDIDAVLALAPPRLVDPSTFAPVTPCALTILGVGRATVEEEDAAPFAAALSTLFPALRQLWHQWDHPALGEPGLEDTQEAILTGRWGQIAEATRAFAQVRRQEQKWALKQRRAAQGQSGA